MRPFAALKVAVYILGLHPDAKAATRYVNATNPAPLAPYTTWANASTSLQMAVEEAVTGDEILVAPGIYYLPGDAVTVPLEKNLILRSTHSRAAILDARYLSPVLLINSSNSVVEGFTLRHGLHHGYGGGLSLLNRSIARDCLIISNHAHYGGGVSINGQGELAHSTISGNHAEDQGGGVVLYDNTLGTLHHCRITGNTASNAGGGVWIQGGGSASNCWLEGNRTLATNDWTGGGGVYMASEGYPNGGTLVNCVLTHNESGYYGGGLYAFGPAGTLALVANCTVVSNTARVNGGGAFAYTTRFINNILYHNSAPAGPNLESHGLSSLVQHCCVYPDFGGFNFTNAPSFVSLAGQDYHLMVGSWCIDTGTNNSYTPACDYEDRERPLTGRAGGWPRHDVGAYEYAFQFAGLRAIATNTLQLMWDVEDRGIYWVEASTNGQAAATWLPVSVYTNVAVAGVYTQTLIIPPTIPRQAIFRLRVSHTAF